MKTNTNKCPNCGSNEISKPQFSRQAIALTILLLGFPFVFVRKIRHCFACGLDFRMK